MSHTSIKAVLLGSGAAIAMAAVAVPAAAGELDDLRGQIEALQVKLATLEQNQVVDQQQSYVAAPANAVVGGDKPGSFRLPGSNTSVAIGGYAKLDLIYDFDNDIGDSFSATAIALDGPGDRVDDNFTMHAKQSRIWIRTWTPTDWGEFATHIEGDFEGGGENHLVSNSTHFRLRHAYGQLGNILAGQTWSNFNTPWAWASTIDFNGTNGTSFIRQAQIRYTASLGNGLSLAVSIENPETSGVRCTDTSVATPVNCDVIASPPALFAESLGLGPVSDTTPDFVARLQWGADWGTVALAGVARYGTVHSIPGPVGPTTGADESFFGWGVKAAAVVKLWGKDSIGAEVIYGDGIGRYALFAVGRSALVSVEADGDLDIETITAFGGSVWIEHWWTDTLYSVALAGFGELDVDLPTGSTVLAHGGLNESFWDVRVNLQWQPVPRANIGIEWIHAHRATFAGAEGDADRIQVGFTWGFST